MDKNYEAQRQFTRQRLDSRREQAAAERLLREGQPPQTNGLGRFFSRLFRRSTHPQGKEHTQRRPSAAPAAAGRHKR